MLLELAMSEEEPMTITERRKYIYKMWGRYRKSSKSEKGRLLDEMEQVTGMHRKSLIRILTGRLSRKKRVRERGPTYGAEVADAVRVIARSLEYPCAERLKPNLVWMGEHLMGHDELEIRSETFEKMARISVSTLKRMLKRVGRSEAKLAFRKPPSRQRNHLRRAYPMRRIPYDTVEPGHFEVDLVVHSGEDTSGEFIHTIQVVDIATGWSEIEAVYGKSYKVMKDGFESILARLPFPVLELHPDNGSEFFNQHLLRFWKKEIVDLEITRSRPYHKNDNRFVEENNRSHVRAYVGHGRLDTPEQLFIMRELYPQMSLYHNYFQPVMRTREKVFSDPFHYRRIFDLARPPFDRLCEQTTLPAETLISLQNLRCQSNPIQLRDQIEALISKLWACPSNTGRKSVNVYHTLRKEFNSSVTLSVEPSIPVR